MPAEASSGRGAVSGCQAGVPHRGQTSALSSSLTPHLTQYMAEPPYSLLSTETGTPAATRRLKNFCSMSRSRMRLVKDMHSVSS